MFTRFTLGLAFLSSLLFAQAEPVVFAHVDVFDGYRMLRNQTVVIAGGMIREVSGASIATPPNAQVVEGKGKTLLPGLIDAHAHISHADSLEQAAALGVTTVLDMFNFPDQITPLRSELKEGKLKNAADFRSAIIGVTVTGGAPSEMAPPGAFPTLRPSDDIQAFVDARIAEGSDYIKIFDEHRFPTLTFDQLKQVVAAAHKRNKLTAVHIGSEKEALEAVRAGADCIEHIFDATAPTPEFILEAASHHVSDTPTLSVLQEAAGEAIGAQLAVNPRFKPYLFGWSIQILNVRFPAKVAQESHFPYALATVKALHSAGVPILAGTDSPNPGTGFGASLHQELLLLTRAGLTPAEALEAATVNPALQFGLIDRGRVEVGRRADLLLVDGDPTEDILCTRKIAGVWKEGLEIDRTAVAKLAEDSRKGTTVH